jgi:hypothetical protein
MQTKKHSTTITIDGYEISATFSDTKNTDAIGQVKQILLSSFASSPIKNRHGDILAITSEQRNNHDRGNPCVPRKVHISAY